MQKKSLYNLLIILTALLFQLEARAQQNYINVPSSSVLPRGDIILKQSNNFKPWNPDAFVSLSPSITLGIGHNIEVAGGVGVSISDDTRVRGMFAAKKVFFLTDATRFTAGTRINPNLQELDPPGNFTYAHVSARIRQTRTTMTAGVFVASNDDDFLPEQPGAMLGLEQSFMSNRLRLVVDWISRNESYGLLSAGVKYRFTPTLSVTNAVMIPNGDRGTFAFKVSISKLLSRQQ